MEAENGMWGTEDTNFLVFTLTCLGFFALFTPPRQAENETQKVRLEGEREGFRRQHEDSKLALQAAQLQLTQLQSDVQAANASIQQVLTRSALVFFCAPVHQYDVSHIFFFQLCS
jgi:hypothetical protein